MLDMELSPLARSALLDLAYQTIVDAVHMTSRPAAPVYPDDPALMQCAGAFVTLMRCGELRGCVGYIQADMPLWEVVQRMAISAAESDPRFLPLTCDELDDLEIEISVLSPLQRIEDAEQVEVGRHGVMIAKAGRRGLLLPQVATERGWNRNTFLQAVCAKAGLPRDSWRHGAALYTFTALVFGAHYGSHAPQREARAII
jgi:AmmeMemoRadiSam system protein A